MLSKIIKLNPEFRFHARPAGVLAAKAKEYESVIMLLDGERIADTKNFVSVMALGKPTSAEVELFVDGADEAEAMAVLAALLITLE